VGERESEGKEKEGEGGELELEREMLCCCESTYGDVGGVHTLSSHHSTSPFLLLFSSSHTRIVDKFSDDLERYNNLFWPLLLLLFFLRVWLLLSLFLYVWLFVCVFVCGGKEESEW